MLRFTLFATTLLLASCATTRTSGLVASGSSDSFLTTAPHSPTVLPSPAAPADGAHAAPFAALESETLPSEFSADPSALARSPALAMGSPEGNRITFKGGYYGSTEDALDDGYILDVAWTRFLNKLFALEFEVGYTDLDGSDSGVDTDLWSVPLMVNGRVNVPIWILEVYGGLGLGGFYYDIDASGALDDSDSGFLFGGNAFLGASIDVGDRLALGLEAKYYATDDISDFDTGLDAFAVMLTLGFNR
jgi:opacity protein-like surface antigen